MPRTITARSKRGVASGVSQYHGIRGAFTFRSRATKLSKRLSDNKAMVKGPIPTRGKNRRPEHWGGCGTGKTPPNIGSEVRDLKEWLVSMGGSIIVHSKCGLLKSSCGAPGKNAVGQIRCGCLL